LDFNMVLEAETINGWTQHKIKDFGVVSTGTTPSTKNQSYYGGEYKLISPADLTDSKYIFTAHKFITAEGLKFARTIPKNAVLVGCIGNVGKIGMTTDEISAFNQQINAIVCNDNFNADFVYYLLRYQRPLLESKAMKVTLPILNKNNFENIEFEVPTLPEQKSIARVLATVQEAIARQEELITKLKELKRGMMQYLFTHGTKGEKTKMTEIGEVPESWEIVNLSKICKFEYGKSLPVKNRINGHVPVYGSNGIVGYHDQAMVDLPGIIIGRKGSAGLVHFSKTSFFAIDTTFYITQKETDQDVKFLFYLLQKLDLTKLKADVGVPGVNREMAYREVIAYPKDINEQGKISQNIDLIQNKIDLTEEKLSAYQNLFKTLLHELMSGERRIRF